MQTGNFDTQLSRQAFFDSLTAEEKSAPLAFSGYDKGIFTFNGDGFFVWVTIYDLNDGSFSNLETFASFMENDFYVEYCLNNLALAG